MITSSIFNSANDNIPKDFDLFQWLEWTINPPKEYEQKVMKYRETYLRKDKIKIPCITPSAAFKEVRDLQHIKHHNPIICFDIDRFAKKKTAPQNPCINFDLAKEFFSRHTSCIYAGFSCSGNDDGLYVIMHLAESDKLNEYFDYFKEVLALKGINIDENCKDYTRCRFFSVDREAYFNPNAKPFKLPQFKKEVAAGVSKPVERKSSGIKIIDDIDKVWKIILECERLNIDITSDYMQWVKIGAGLYNSFGEDGRSLYHRISALNSGYSYKETDTKFNQCKKMKTTIASFFGIASDYGVRY